MGSPRSGKTSMLEYLRAPETQATLYNDETERLIVLLRLTLIFWRKLF